jgi:thioredoxin reductase
VFFSAAAGQLDSGTEHRLAARGIELVASRVAEVVGDGDRVTGVRTEEGTVVAVDAVFTGGTPRPRDDFLAGLGLDRTDTPLGNFLAVDAAGRTSHNRIWAAGNVTDPAQNVSMAISAGAVAGGMVNMALVTEDFDNAVARPVEPAHR